MSTKISFTILAVLLGVNIGQSAPPAVKGFTSPAKTSVPFTYCIDYRPDPDAPNYLDNLKLSPPDLLHVGYHIPFNGALGPTYGHELYTNEILPPHEIPREINRVEKLISKIRSTGVDNLIPYVYTMAFFGLPDERTGFFNFYDHWDDYRVFGLGAKPAADPSLWSQVRGPMQLGGGPPGILHYEPCINHPAWAEYLDLVVRELARVGYDGMFFDVNTLYCYCPHCQEKFDIYLLNKYGRKALKEIFGTYDHRQIDLSTIYQDFEKLILTSFKPYLAGHWNSENISNRLGLKDTSEVKLANDWRLLRCYMQNSLAEFPPKNDFESFLAQRFGGLNINKISAKKREEFIQTVLRYHFHRYLESSELVSILEQNFASSDIKRRCCSNQRDMLLWVETQRFWCQSMANQFARLKKEGRRVFAEQGRKDDFYTVANLGSMVTMDGLNKRRVDGIDMTHWAPQADMQMLEEMNQVGMLESGVIFSNIFGFKWAMAVGTKAGPLLYKVSDDRAADLAHAEVAAAGGGAFIQPGLGAPESRKHWRQFYDEHKGLWDGGDSWDRVGLLFWSDQVFYENTGHLAASHALVHILSENQVPFDMIAEDNIQDIKQYQVIFAPQLRYLDEPQIFALLEYARHGGNLIIIKPFGSEDKYARPMDSQLLKKVTPGNNPISLVKHGMGKIVWLERDAVPERRSDLWSLMEERGNTFLLARDFLNEKRLSEIAKGVDLGQKFIAKLEESLQEKLRWCPPETDAGVYIHAYHLSAKDDQAERLVLHVVNYHMPILLEQEAAQNQDAMWATRTISGEPQTVRNLEITVPVLPDRKVSQITTVSPTEKIQHIEWTQKGETAKLKINKLKIYLAIVLEFKT